MRTIQQFGDIFEDTDTAISGIEAAYKIHR